MLKSRFQKMIGVQFLGTLMTLLDRYACVPLLVHFWGLSVFGEWLLIRIIPTYLSMFEAGFPSAAGNKIVTLMAEGKKQEAANLYAVTSRIMNYISLFVISGILVALYFGNPRSFLNIQDLNIETTAMVILLTTLHTVLIFQTQLLYALYRSAHQQVYWNIIIQSTRLGEFIMVVLTASLHGHVVMTAAGIAFARFCGMMFLRVKAKDKIPLSSLAVTDNSFELSRSLLKSGVGFFLIPMAQALNIQGFVWLVGVLISPAMAAVFNIYRVYSRLIFQVGDIIRRALWPELTAAYADNQFNVFIGLFKKSLLSVVAIATIACLISYFLAGYIIPYWTLGKVDNNPTVIGLLLLVSFIGAIRYVVFTVATSINRHTRLVLLEVIINLIAIGILKYLGISSFIEIAYVLVMIEAIISIFVFANTRDIIKKLASKQK